MLINTEQQSFDMQDILNRRFIFNPQSGTLILGRQYFGNQIISSHAEEHGRMNTGELFDDFLRGWIGTGGRFESGVIHFSPPIPQSNPEAFDMGYIALEMFARNGASDNTVIRGFPGDWEQPLLNIINSNKLTELRKEREPMNEPLNIQLTTREAFERGDTDGGAWLKLPATAEQLQTALARIGAQDGNFFVNGFETPIPAIQRIPLANMQNAGIDELNFLAAKLEMLNDTEVEKLNIISVNTPFWDDVHHMAEQAHNKGFYEHHPGVVNHALLGEHVIEHSGLIQIPEKWAGAIDHEKLGQIVHAEERGILDEEHGYLVESGIDEGWQAVTEIPQEYRIAPEARQPEREPEQQGDPNINSDAIAANAPSVAAVTAAPFVLVADNPKDRMKEITDRLERGIQGIFDSEQYKSYLQTLAKFHNYSLNNCLLIAMQKPEATRVAGFNAWRDDFKRPVMKGEKGMKILAPSSFKAKKQVDKLDADGKPVIGSDGKRVKEEKEITVPAYTVVTVFDVSQTDGEPLPSLGVNELVGSVDKYKEFFAALEKTSPVPVAFENITKGAKGYHHMVENRIAINDGMSELQNLKTLIHEISHARLHAIDANLSLKEQNLPDRRTREVEAESIAYTVCQHYGLDTADYSFGYVAGWSGSKETDILKSSLETIRKEASAIITEVDKHLAELSQDMEQGLGQEAKEGLEQIAEESLQWFIDEDMKNHGELRAGTLEMIAVQGYEYKDGKLEKAVSAENPAPEQSAEDAGESPAEPKTMPTYYSINETAARHAKEANSFSDYKPGSATAEYRQSVDKAYQLAERHKAGIDPMYHAKIDRLVDTYARKLAENMNNRNSIDARVPSVLIAGPSNFPVRQKEKQNAARDTNMREWQDIQGLLDKIRSTGMGGISADDPNAIQKLQSKLEGLQQSQETMKSVNAYYRKNKTLDGCPDLSADQINRLKADMSRSWRPEPKPFESWALSNNNAEINRTKGRIEQLTRHSVAVYVGWQINGGRVEPNQKDNRLQVLFDGKPDESIRNELKSNGFRWSPNAGAWQRQLNDNAIYAADRIKCLEPTIGEKPTDLQRAARAEAKNAAALSSQPQEQEQDEPEQIQGGTFTIYQLKQEDSTRDYRFEPLDRLQAAGLDADLANYDVVYTAPIGADTNSLGMIYEKFNISHPEDFSGHSLSVSDIVVMNRDGTDTAFYVDSIGFKELPDFLTPKEQAAELPTPDKTIPPVDLKAVADYMQKQNDTIQAADPNKTQGQAAFNSAINRLEQANERIPGEHPQLKALITSAAQSPDLATLKERMTTMQNEFTQHYSTAVQMTIDTGGKAEPKTPAATVRQTEPAPKQKPPEQGENVAAIEAKVNAGETINLTDLSDAIKKDKQAAAQKSQTGKAEPKTGQTRAASQGKGAAKPAAQKKPSIRDELAAGKKQLAAQKPAPSKAQSKNAELGG